MAVTGKWKNALGLALTSSELATHSDNRTSPIGGSTQGFRLTHTSCSYATTPELTVLSVVPPLRRRMRRHDAMADNWYTRKALNGKPEKGRFDFDRMCRPGRLIPITVSRQGRPNTDHARR